MDTKSFNTGKRASPWSGYTMNTEKAELMGKTGLVLPAATPVDAAPGAPIAAPTMASREGFANEKVLTAVDKPLESPAHGMHAIGPLRPDMAATDGNISKSKNDVER